MKTESQLDSRFRAEVIKRAGTQTLERTYMGAYVVTDGWLSDWVTFLGEGKWVQDGVLKFNKPLIELLNTLAFKMKPYRIQYGKRDSLYFRATCDSEALEQAPHFEDDTITEVLALDEDFEVIRRVW